MNDAEKFLQGLINADKTPCVHYIIFNKENIIYEFADGFADIKQQVKVNRQTIFHAFSITKTITALAILQLAAQQKLDIEQPVKNYLQDFPYSGNITTHQLLTHSAGIPNPIPLSWIHTINEHSSFDRNNFFKNIFRKHNKTRSQPNKKFFYSNLGYVLLGDLIEKITGCSYEQYITENIISKLGLQNAELGFTINEHSRHTKGYQKTLSITNLLLGLFLNKSKFMDNAEGGWKPFKPFYLNGTSYGGMFGTATGLMKYAQELLRPDSKLISDHYKKLLFTENRSNDNKPTGMSLSWFCGELNSKRYFAHPGGGGGSYCEIRLYPEIETGSVITFNRTGISNEKFLDRVDKFFI